MSKRIVCIALLSDDSLLKINNLISKTGFKLCKVPFIEEERESIDTLPFHLIFCIWNYENKNDSIKIFNLINFKSFKINITDLKIKESYNGTYNLYLDLKKTEEWNKVQTQIYKLSKNEKYNPNSFIPHITIHCDKDYNTILKLKNELSINFSPFEIEISNIGLFEIYPAKKII